MGLALRLPDRTIDLDRHAVCVGDATVALTAREVEVLRYLADRLDQVVLREQLERDVWQQRAGVRSQAIPVAMRRLRQKLEADPANPRSLLTISGRGWRLLAERVQPTPTPAAPSPALLSPLLGREDALAQLAEAVSQPGLVTLVGLGGSGKSRLALELLRMYSGGPTVWVDAAAHDQGSRVVQALAHELGVSAVAPGSLEAALARQDAVLVLLDNCDGVALGGVLSAWLAACPALRVLVTRRRPVELPLERVHGLDGLDTRDPAGPAVTLFLERAGATAATWPAEERAAVPALVAALDGLPLAIELAAARSNLLSPTRILSRLGERFRLLRRRAGPVRHRTLEAVLLETRGGLDPHEDLALCQLAAFRGSFSLEAAEAVLDLGDADAWPLDVVGRLVSGHLLTRAESGRLRLPRCLRDLVVDLLGHASTDARARHARWYSEAARPDARRAILAGTEHGRPLIDDLDELIAAVDGALAVGDPASAVACARAVSAIVELRGPPALAIDLLRRVMSRVPEPWLRVDLARALYVDGQATAAREQAAAAERAPGEHRASAWKVLADIARLEGRLEHADACCEAAMALAVEPVEQAAIASTAAAITLRRGDIAAARRGFESALQSFRAAGHLRGEAVVLANLGNLTLRTGDRHGAKEAFELSGALFERVGDAASRAQVLASLGGLHLALGEVGPARALLEQALALMRRLGVSRAEPVALENLALLDTLQGHLVLARRRCDHALALQRRRGGPKATVNALSLLAAVQLADDRPAEAVATFDEALALLDGGIAEREVAQLQGHRAAALWALDRRDDALAELVAAAETLESYGEAASAAGFRVDHARLSLAAGDRSGATSVARAVVALRASGRSVLLADALIVHASLADDPRVRAEALEEAGRIAATLELGPRAQLRRRLDGAKADPGIRAHDLGR